MIVIDAGHGGTDPGTSGNGLIEKDYTLLMSNYMYERFKELGLDVKIVRTTDETLTPTERVDRIMAAYGANSNVIVISNHLNAGGGSGAEIIYALRNTDELSTLMLDNLGKTGIPTRKVYQRASTSDPSQDYYFIHRETAPNEAVIIEYGFLDNASDAEFIKNNYKKMVDSIVESVIEYIGFEAQTDTTATYTVSKGDTLSSIALKYDTTVTDLKTLNNLTSDTIYIDQVLKIPNTSNVLYTVKSGDTLYSIAKNFNTTVENIKELNNLTSDLLQINQILNITSEVDTPAEISYTVEKGDTLYSIAKKYSTTVADIERLNGLTSNILSIGQILQIPTYTDKTEYTVKLGDTLYSIAKTYNTTVDSIKINNNLSNNILSIGQKLNIY